MKFTFSNLQVHSINRKTVYVFDEHQYALPLWAEFSISNSKQYGLVTFDFHTDTRQGFNRYACLQNSGELHRVWDEFRINYVNSITPTDIKAVVEATKNLANDEHICAALNFGYIDNAHVVNVENEHHDLNIFYYRIKTPFDLESIEITQNPYERDNGLTQFFLNRIEDDYLVDTGFSIPPNPFILDFDLDYFPTRESLNPKNRKIITELISKAQIITVAREEFYFEKNRKQQGFDVREAESLLLKLIEDVLLKRRAPL